MQARIRSVFMRGGTSKGLFFREADLPEDPALRDAILLRVMGSPDARQIDGLGSGFSSASKAARSAHTTRLVPQKGDTASSRWPACNR